MFMCLYPSLTWSRTCRSTLSSAFWKAAISSAFGNGCPSDSESSVVTSFSDDGCFVSFFENEFLMQELLDCLCDLDKWLCRSWLGWRFAVGNGVSTKVTVDARDQEDAAPALAFEDARRSRKCDGRRSSAVPLSVSVATESMLHTDDFRLSRLDGREPDREDFRLSRLDGREPDTENGVRLFDRVVSASSVRNGVSSARSILSPMSSKLP